VKLFTAVLEGITVDTPEGPLHGEPRALPCYQEEHHVKVTVEGGQEAVSTVQVWLDPVDVGLGDRVTVTNSAGEQRTLRVLAVDRYDGSRRAAHVALKLG
jgi:hypothetical protein